MPVKTVAIDAKIVREFFSYDPETGQVKWIVKRPRIRVGMTAGYLGNNGYLMVRFSGKTYTLHRVIFVWQTGRQPSGLIDHIDGNPSNNKWSNLRECTSAQNSQNRRVNTTSKSGFLGVGARKDGFQATIAAGGVDHYLGLYRTAEEAHEAYLSAKRRLHGFNPSPRDGASTLTENI